KAPINRRFFVLLLGIFILQKTTPSPWFLIQSPVDFFRQEQHFAGKPSYAIPLPGLPEITSLSIMISHLSFFKKGN
ncbi:MAG TPA: hypothetical protein PLX12_06350, partial [Flexilinea sp.]|nr:hypothetical protein [Flexilinea sp.]